MRELKIMFFHRKYLEKEGTCWLLVLATLSILFASLVSLFNFFSDSKSEESYVNTSDSESIRPATINALGKIKPQEVISLSPTPSIEGVRLAELMVEEGDEVLAGESVAVLDSYDRLRATLEEARGQEKVARANLAQVTEGAKSGEIEAQQAIISRLESQLQWDIQSQQTKINRLGVELRNAENEYSRYAELYESGAVSESLFDSQKLQVETLREQVTEAKVTLNRIISTTQEQIHEAKATLDKISEVRTVDVAVAQAEVEKAISSVHKAEANFEIAHVRSPIDGQVLVVHAKEGEVIGPEGVVEIANTNSMFVVAEVHEADIIRIEVGQKATIISEYGSFAGELVGFVDQISLRVGRQNIEDHDPAAEIDVRIVEVKIKLRPEDSEKIKRLTDAHVQVSIHL
jgi:HlyD family secretion protein